MRPNQVDPHEKERQEIAQKFSDSSPKIVIQTEKTSNSTEQPGKSTTEDTYTTFDQVCIYPSRAEGGPEGADRGEAHLNDVRFNSN